LQLPAAQAAFVHHEVERMLVVITFLTHRSQLRAQFVERQQRVCFLV
jgi:hypothetical protein